MSPHLRKVFLAAAVCFGVVGGTICNFATQIKFYLRYDDALDIFAVHTIGGLVGNVCSTLINFSPY
jgi:ammonium transporter, Amt family